MPETRALHCTIHFSAAAPAGSVARLKVEDVSRADAAAIIVGETEVALPAGAAAGTDLPVVVQVVVPDGAPSLSARVHVSGGGAPHIESGDLVSTRANPVLTNGAPDAVVVEAVPV